MEINEEDLIKKLTTAFDELVQRILNGETETPTKESIGRMIRRLILKPKSEFVIEHEGLVPYSPWLSSELLEEQESDPRFDLWAMRGGFRKFTVLTSRSLTPRYLAHDLIPYLEAIAEMQKVLNEISGQLGQVVIKKISQRSPIGISLLGASEALTSLREDLVPWRKANAKKMASLKEKDIEADVEKKRAEVIEIRARSAKDRAEARRLRAEAAKMAAEAEKQLLENEKLRFEIEKSKLALAVEIVSKLRSNLSESEKLFYAVKLLPHLNTLATSEVEFLEHTRS